MDAVDAMKRAVNASHQWYQGTMADVSTDQANYLPDGVAHPIGELAAHTVQSEDYIINQMLRKEPMLWVKDGWEGKLGIPNVVRHDNATARGFTCDPQSLLPYTQAVFANTETYLSGLNAGDLDRTMDLQQLGTMTVADVLFFLLVGNTFAHTGEISALKGIQGAKGYPF